MTTRLDGWPDLLMEEIARHTTSEFVWGQEDCLTFPMDCVLAITGSDPSAPYRGTYDTALGAARVLESLGFVTIGDAFAAHFEEIHPSMAQRGDIGIVEGEAATSGVVFADVPYGKDTIGLLRVTRAQVTRAFKVP